MVTRELERERVHGAVVIINGVAGIHEKIRPEREHRRINGKAIGPVFLDASFGLGPDLISRTSIGHQRKSTVLQFTDEMGVGISDLKKRVRLSLTYRHISNIDIKLPNNGTNFVGMGLSYRFHN